MKIGTLKLLDIGTVVLVTFLTLTGCSEDHRWHQKLTLVIDTPQGEVRGASVVEVRAAFDANPSAITGREVSYDVTGESTVVEIAPGRRPDPDAGDV